ncbi:YcnI family protein [Dactylosporangium sp. NPDC050588]|uniref:YcnI family protein n=1 Tax=Dactylosporangium sp. NPDC050588 TaxID=3157211 RepID=UPI00340525D1
MLTVTWQRIAVAGAVIAAALLLPGVAAAHVSVTAEDAVPGKTARLTFRVPNESDTASTVKLELVMPAATPIAFVALKAVPGWTATTERGPLPTPVDTPDGRLTEAVTKVTWTAASGGGIKPGYFEDFELSAGPLPDVGTIVFKALQTYSDGEVSRWIEEPTGGQEPADPAPVLHLNRAAPGSAPPAAAAAAAPAATGSSGTGPLPVVLSAAALAVAVAALVLTVAGARRAARDANRRPE